jgi:hypothetical protein
VARELLPEAHTVHDDSASASVNLVIDTVAMWVQTVISAASESLELLRPPS